MGTCQAGGATGESIEGDELVPAQEGKGPRQEPLSVQTKDPWVDAGISSEYYSRIVAEFTCLDANGDHKLNRKEFQEASKLQDFLGMTPLDIKHLFDQVDVDSSGEISFKEFLVYMARRKDHLPLPVQVDPQKRRLNDNLTLLAMELCTTDRGIKGVIGDGNCQFYSLSWHLFATTAKHGDVRSKVIQHLRGPEGQEFAVFYAPEHPSQPPTFDGYLDMMSKDYVWGDQLTLQAAANAFNFKVHLLTSNRFDSSAKPAAGQVGGRSFGAVETLVPSKPAADSSPKEFWISFAAQHYSPIQPTDRTPKEVLHG